MLSYIYFLRDDSCGFIKIGCANNPFLRIQFGRAFNPHPVSLLGIIEGDRKDEAKLHARFQRSSNYAIEWFHPTSDLLELIRKESLPFSFFRKEFGPFLRPKKFKRCGYEPLAFDWLSEKTKAA